MIGLSLRRYSADRIGRFDFALESSGGSVMLNKCSPTYSRTVTSISLFGMIPLWNYISTPKVIIRVRASMFAWVEVYSILLLAIHVSWGLLGDGR